MYQRVPPPLPGATCPRPRLGGGAGGTVNGAVDLALNTMKAYRGQWRHFRTWCQDQVLEPLPAVPRTVALWLASRWDQGAAVSSLKLGRAAVCWIHRETGHEDPTQDVAVTRFLGACSRGQQRRHGAASTSRSAIPADADLVRAMMDAIRWTDVAWKVAIRDRALIATAYVTAAWHSELGALLLADVEADGIEFQVRITRSMTKKRTAGVINSRSIRAADHLADWLDFHPLRGVPEVPLFVQLHRSGSCPARDHRPQHPPRRRCGRFPGRSTNRGAAAAGRLAVRRNAGALCGQ